MKKSKSKADNKGKTAPPSFDPEAYSVEADYISANGKPERTIIRAGKPNKNEFVFVYGDQRRDVYLCELGKMQNLPTYLVHPDLLKAHPQLQEVMVLRRLFLAITSEGHLFIWETAIYDPLTPNSWAKSGERAIEGAAKRWVRVVPVKKDQAYVLYDSPQPISDPPQPPEMTILEAIKLAYRDQVINSADHPLIKPLLGKRVV